MVAEIRIVHAGAALVATPGAHAPHTVIARRRSRRGNPEVLRFASSMRRNIVRRESWIAASAAPPRNDERAGVLPPSRRGSQQARQPRATPAVAGMSMFHSACNTTLGLTGSCAKQVIELAEHDAGGFELPATVWIHPWSRARQTLAEAAYLAHDSSASLSAGLSWRASSPPSPRQKSRSAARTR